MAGKARSKPRAKKAELPPRAMAKDAAELEAAPMLDLAPTPARPGPAPVPSGSEPPPPEPDRDVQPRSNRVTYYVVQRFIRDGKGRLVGEMARQASDRAAADRLAKRLSESSAGTAAFSQTVDPDIGDVEDTALIARYGEVPEDLLELA